MYVFIYISVSDAEMVKQLSHLLITQIFVNDLDGAVSDQMIGFDLESIYVPLPNIYLFEMELWIGDFYLFLFTL